MQRNNKDHFLLLCTPEESESFYRRLILIKDLAIRNEIQSSDNKMEKGREL